MADIKVDIAGFLKAQDVFNKAGANAPAAIFRSLVAAGEAAKKQMTGALVDQTGLSRKVILRAVKSRASKLSYSIRVKGGDVRAKYFGPQIVGSGVVASPWNRHHTYTGAFMRGGVAQSVHFTKKGMSGGVFKRVGKRRLKIVQQRTGMYIPKELVRGDTADAFRYSVAGVLPHHLMQELERIFVLAELDRRYAHVTLNDELPF